MILYALYRAAISNSIFRRQAEQEETVMLHKLYYILHLTKGRNMQMQE